MVAGQLSRSFPEDQGLIRPALSLDVHFAASNEVRDLAIALSDDDGEVSPSMEEACQLVHMLLDQVAWDDAPPTNDEMSTAAVTKELRSPRGFSRQCHVPPTSALQGHHPQSRDADHDDPSKLWSDHYNTHCNPTEQKLGNVALATLCARTLETVGKPSRPSKEVGSKRKVSPTATKTKSPRWGRKNPSPKMYWLRRKQRKSLQTTKNPHHAEIVVSQQALKVSNPKGFFEIEERDDLASAPSSTVMETEEPSRLQMFGSEYARYLSTTALAPKELSSARVPAMPRTNLVSRAQRTKRIQHIEGAELSVITGPITDLIITHGEDPPPKGYYRISQSAGGERFFLRDRRTPAYINVKKETNWDRAAQRPCVTALALIFPQRKEFVPPGFSVVRRHSSLPKSHDRNPANLNLGEEQVFLCFRRSREGNPITGILPMQPSRRENIPEGYTVLERTPRNFVASIQTQVSHVFLAYRQRLANLEPLRPLPLVMSVHNTSSTTRRLHSYYCTGGTVVESRVGRFHIMDRSTHSLLSPSSVSNRLSLIEASRRKMLNSIADLPNNVANTYAYSAKNADRKPQNWAESVTSSLLLANGLGTPGSRSVISDLEKLSSAGDYESETSSVLQRSLVLPDQDQSKSVNRSFSTASSTTDDDSYDVAPSHPSSQPIPGLLAAEDKELERCLQALSFIPVVSSSVEESDARGMLRFQARVGILTPILTACYTRHGGSALLAVNGLTKLLKRDFFSSDVNMEQESSTRITLLDISVQVVCDVATMGTQETHLHACVEFVESAVKYGCGYLNTRTVGYVLRFYLFVFYFGVSTPVGSSGTWGMVKGTDHPLLEDPRENGISYLPGGAPQSAILSLKDLIAFSISRLRALAATERMAYASRSPTVEGRLAPDIFNDIINSVVDDVIDTSVHRVDVANYTQLALHQIRRSGGSELFWYDMMNSCGSGLFGGDSVLSEETRSMYAMLFALLANCVKTASSKIRKDKNSEGVPRDIASKLMSLEMLLSFLEKWDESKGVLDVPKSRSFSTFVFCIRRLVVPCLLSNTEESLDDPRVYRRVIRIVGTLWCSPIYRQHMKLEIGILMDHFVLRILRLGPQILYKNTPKDEEDMTFLFAQQIELLTEMKKWFTDSNGLMELFLNFDGESGVQQVGASKEFLSGLQWKISDQICASLCSMSEKCGEFIAQQIRESQGPVGASPSKPGGDHIEVLEGVSGTTLARESAQRLRKLSMGAISQIVRSLAETAASSRGPKYRSLVDSWASCKDGVPSEQTDSDNSVSDEEDEPDPARTPGSTAVLDFWQKAIADDAFEKVSDEETKETKHLRTSFGIARDKGLRKAVDYLIACNILTPSPRDIASFLRIHRAELRPQDLGKYLGEGGSDGSEIEFWNLVRFSYIRAISFVGLTVEQGLRHLLTNGGFRLPGEAQQVDRLLTTFSQCYWEDNAGDHINCPFHDQEIVFVLSFAIIMLNTDLHKSGAASSNAGKRSNARKNMTKTEFLNNLRGAVTSKPEDLNQDYLSLIYDSIQARPIVLHDDFDIADGSSVCSSDRLSWNLSSMIDNAKSLDALLRALSIHEYRFFKIEDNDHPSATRSNLARRLMSHSWHQFHGLINAALEIAHLDPKGMDSCAGLLRYALCVTICLDMPMERAAFLGQLGRFRLFNECKNGIGNERSSPGEDHDNYKQEDWYKGIEEACSSRHGAEQGKLMSLKLVNELVNDMGLSLAVDKAGNKAMRDAVRRLANAEHLLNDPIRSFLRTGSLLKRANRSGRCSEYQFFLFSDVLIYAKKIPGSNQYKIHEELPLILMKVVDWFPPEMKRGVKRAFQIYHPRKSFLAFCSSKEERSSWVTTIRLAIDKELSRKVAIEGARMAAAKSH